MTCEELIAECQMRMRGARTANEAMKVSSEFDKAVRWETVPVWILLLRAMSTRVNLQKDYIRKLEASNDQDGE